MTDRTHLAIGEVLSLLRNEFPDVTISKIRFLESQGLVDPERTPSGYRKFYEQDVQRLRWILLQQRENFLPLKVIKDRLEEGDLGDGFAVSASKAATRGHGPDEVRHASEEAGSSPVSTRGGSAHVATMVMPDLALTDPPPPPAGSTTTSEPSIVAAAAPPRSTSSARRPAPMSPLPASVASPVSAAPHQSEAEQPLPTLPGPTSSGPTSPGPTSSGPTSSGPTSSGPTSSSRAGAASPGAAPRSSHSAAPSVAPTSAAGNRTAAEPPAVTSPSSLSTVDESPSEPPTPPAHGSNVTDSAAGTAAPRPDRSAVASADPSTSGGDAARPAASSAAPVATAASSAAAGSGASGRPGGNTSANRAPRGSTVAPVSDEPDALSLEELAAEAGMDLAAVAELEQYGLISPAGTVGGVAYFDRAALTVVRTAVGFARHGIEARHLRSWRNGAEREASVFEQIVMPLLRQRNPHARQQAAATLEELAALGADLRAALLDQALRNIR